MVGKIYCFDLDLTLCLTSGLNYSDAKAIPNRILCVNRLFDQGNYIKIFTARGSETGFDWREVTAEQLRSWGLKYHELILGKPAADFYVDDKAVNSDDFDWGSNS